MLDEGNRDALTPMILLDGEVVDVCLPPCALEFIGLVGDESSDNAACRHGDQGDHVFLRKQLRPAAYQ